MSSDRLSRAAAAIAGWEASFRPFERHPSTEVPPAVLDAALDELTARLGDNYPYFHPRYAGQMLKPPHPAAVAGYVAAMLVNPNNHALDGGRATSELEKELMVEIAAMFHLPRPTLGHLTTSGTIANLEALFVARETHPGKAVAFSAESHYTHARMCHVLGIESVTVPADDEGRINLELLERELAGGRIGTVVLTAGTTGTGAVDPIDRAIQLRDAYGCRLHVDAAYGGFFSLLAWQGPPRAQAASGAPGATAAAGGAAAGEQPEPSRAALGAPAAAAIRAIAECDSVVVDPHKHGLQPYGCGAVVFADPAVGRFYAHDSPYTYFTSSELHLGEISLECSRAGAAAAALWLTLRVLPLTGDGLGAVLRACRQAALRWSARAAASEALVLHRDPELDIVTYYPLTEPLTASRIDAASRDLFARAGDPANELYLSLLAVEAAELARRAGAGADAPTARVLRSVLMKPEHELYVDELFDDVEQIAEAVRR
jgi:glutamate/tyrosine decarboxylase-like PLP-dependent enzyme